MSNPTETKTFEQDGVKLKATATQDEKGKWWLQLSDENSNNTDWEDPFNSLEDAMKEATDAIAEEGIQMFVGNWDSLV
ncbi:MAG: hypothetical protein V7711_11085 [Pseudomonadales bacterium]